MEDLLLAARNTYPNEFFALLGGDKKGSVIDEFVVVPAVYGKNFAMVHTNLVPFDMRVLGSVHSHPSRNWRPSGADLSSFGKFGGINLIIAYPFDINSVRAFDIEGRKLEIEVLE